MGYRTSFELIFKFFNEAKNYMVATLCMKNWQWMQFYALWCKIRQPSPVRRRVLTIPRDRH